jgi:hypothetical protein
MKFSPRLRIFFVIFFLAFTCSTVLAHFLHWDVFLYKRTQDTLVVIIGSTAWVLCARKMLREESYMPYLIGAALSTVIVTMHVLRAIYGDLLC